MPRTLTFEQNYPVDPDRLFDLVIDLDTLDAVTKPWVQFDHLPSGPVRAGQVIDVAMSLFGLWPRQPYTMRVTECDPETRRMATLEEGMGVTRLFHELEVRDAGDGTSVLLDRVEIEAGWKTSLVAVSAWLLYRWRHHIRMRLLDAAQKL
ncbi:MAG: hypothetical protein GJ676_15910 [Rhodobacteraceae bacterium]|nr:hypothetical protein [Paracoccaceae bacterium]